MSARTKQIPAVKAGSERKIVFNFFQKNNAQVKTEQLVPQKEILPLDSECSFIKDAGIFFENPTLLMQIANITGKPLEKIIKIIEMTGISVEKTCSESLKIISKLAMKKFPETDNIDLPFEEACQSSKQTDRKYKIYTGMSGAAGGLGGLFTAPIELPVTTGIMFRSIAHIASCFGEDVHRSETHLECLSIFSLGGANDYIHQKDQSLESTYYTSRIGMTMMSREFGNMIAQLGEQSLADLLQKSAGSVLMKILESVVSKFGVVLSEKLAVMALPIVSVGSAALINVAFTDYFNQAAIYHFGIRHLERKYGEKTIRELYLNSFSALEKQQKKIS